MEANHMSWLENLLQQYRKWRRWKKVVAIASCFVVFITTYALILPAITMTKDTNPLEQTAELSSGENRIMNTGEDEDRIPENEESERAQQGVKSLSSEDKRAEDIEEKSGSGDRDQQEESISDHLISEKSPNQLVDREISREDKKEIAPTEFIEKEGEETDGTDNKELDVQTAEDIPVDEKKNDNPANHNEEDLLSRQAVAPMEIGLQLEEELSGIIEEKNYSAMLMALPNLLDTLSYSDAEKRRLRQDLIEIYNYYESLEEEEKELLMEEAGDRWEQYEALYQRYVKNDSGTINRLTDDWVRLKSFTLIETLDGTGPFDISENPNDPDYKGRQGNDENDHNGIVRTFDTIKYDLGYITEMSGEYDNVAEGYLVYEFILPCEVEEAMFDFTSMAWTGNDYGNERGLNDIKWGENGYYTWNETRRIQGKQQLCQIVKGKRFLVGTDSNPYAFPGNGELDVVIRILNMDNGSKVIPEFNAWMDNNHVWEDHDEICMIHGNQEKKHLTGEPVSVTSELRMNLQLKRNTFTSGLDNFDFANTGNELALNKEKSTVYGRICSYGITVQMQNKITNKGLKGLAIPHGPISFDLHLSSKFKEEDTGKEEEGFIPLLWSYDGNRGGANQDKRDISAYGLSYAVGTPYNTTSNKEMVSLPENGSNACFHGGTWKAQQDGSIVHFTITDCIVNPKWFPNGNAGDRPDNQTAYFNLKNGVYSCANACIAASEIYVVTPYGEKENENYWTDHYTKGDVTLQVREGNLKANSTAGSLSIAGDTIETMNSNQSNKQDDISAVTWNVITGKGTLVNRILYGAVSGEGDVNGEREFTNNGQDACAIGHKFAIRWALVCTPDGVRANALYAANILMKFDDEAIVLNGKPTLYDDGYLDPNAQNPSNYLYVGKNGGWDSDDDMDKTVEGDPRLHYFATLSELEQAGLTCVGILHEYRMKKDALPSMKASRAYARVPVTTKDTYDIAGKAYMTCISSTAWTEAAYQAAGGMIPSRLAIESGEIDHLPAATSYWIDHRENYVKAVYDEYGNYLSGHSGDQRIGDSLYITGYTCGVTKSVAQTISDGLPKALYDMDNNQRVADYVISPSTKQILPTQSKATTTITLEDTLPKGLHYISNSAYYGGNYHQNAMAGKKGIVTEGIQLEPDTSVNKNGTTTLTWNLPNIVVGEEIQQIHYSCRIGEKGSPEDVKNNDILENTVVISSTHDHRIPSLGNNNQAKASIRVAKLREESVSKIPESYFVDAGENLKWTLHVGNNGSNEYEDIVMMDTLPYTGDGETELSGGNKQLKVVEWCIDTSAARNVNTWEAYYTCSEEARNTYSDNYLAEEIRQGEARIYDEEGNCTGNQVQWIPVSINPSTGEIPDLAGKVPTAVIVIGTLYSHETYKAHVTMNVVDPKRPLAGGDRIYNVLTDGRSKGETAISIAYRTLEGTAWLDANMDGIRQAQEELLNGIKVELLKEEEDGSYKMQAVTYTGMQLDLVSEEETEYSTGQYLFKGVKAGTYAVRMTQREETRFSRFIVSEKEKNNIYLNSNADGYYVDDQLRYAMIKDSAMESMVMPDGKELATWWYASRYHDAGFYEKLDIDVVKEWDGDEDCYEDLRPKQVKMQLIADGLAVETVSITEDNKGKWKGSFTDCPKYKAVRGHSVPIRYTISEIPITIEKEDGTKEEIYTPKISGDAEHGFFVINVYDPYSMAIEGRKIWDDQEDFDGIRPDYITIHLYADGEEISSTKGFREDDYRWSFTDLPKRNNKKEVIQYTVEEEPVAGYEQMGKVQQDPEDGDYVFTNYHEVETLEIPLEKRWVNDIESNRPDNIEVTLYRGIPQDSDIVEWEEEEKVYLNKEGLWRHTFENKPKYAYHKEEEDWIRETYQYKVVEAPVSRYTASYAGDMEEGFIVTNTTTVRFPDTGSTGEMAYRYIGIMLMGCCIALLLCGRSKNKL